MTPEERLIKVVMLRQRLKMRKGRLKHLLAINAPEVIIDNEKKLIAQVTAELKEIEPQF